MIKPNIKYPIILILTLVFGLQHSKAQTTISRDVKLRFKGNIVAEKYEDALQSYPNGLIANFNLGIQWWTLMGEPLEYYSFEWESTQKIAISVAKYLNRDELLNYPDLLLRFDNLRPTKLNVSIDGKCGLEPFSYDIPDRKIMYSKAGVLSKNITPNSPKTWNDFWQWSPGLLHNDGGNITEHKFKSLSAVEKKTLISKLQKRYLGCSTIVVKARITDIEWPKNEIDAIFELYQKYEKGETESSPKEKVEAAKDDIANTPTYTKDDFWGEVADVKKPEVEVYSANGGDGLKYKGSDKIVVPAKNDFQIDPVACTDCKEGHQFFKLRQEGEDDYSKLFDQTGEVVIDYSFGSVMIYTNTYKHYVSQSGITHSRSTSPYSYNNVFEDRTPKGDFELVIYKTISSVKKGTYTYCITTISDVLTYDSNMNLLKTKRMTTIYCH